MANDVDVRMPLAVRICNFKTPATTKDMFLPSFSLTKPAEGSYDVFDASGKIISSRNCKYNMAKTIAGWRFAFPDDTFDSMFSACQLRSRTEYAEAIATPHRSLDDMTAVITMYITESVSLRMCCVWHLNRFVETDGRISWSRMLCNYIRICNRNPLVRK